MKTSRILCACGAATGRALRSLGEVGPACALIIVLTALVPAIAADLNVTGNITATGTVDSDGNTTSFGAKSTGSPTLPGVIFTYTDNSVPTGAVDSFQFLINRNPASWLWLHNTPTTGTYNAMRLDNAHQLILYQADGATAGVTLAPVSNQISLGTAILSGSGTTLTTGGALIVTSGITNTNGSFTGGASGLSLNSGTAGTNLSLTAAGAGDIVFTTNSLERARIKSTGNVGIGTTSPGDKLDVGDGTAATGFSVYGNASGSKQSWVKAFDKSGQLIGITIGYGNVDKIVLNGAGNTFFNGGNVGIGTTSPASALQVGSTGSGNTRIGGGSYSEYWVTEPYPRVFLSRDAGGSGISALQFGVGTTPADTTIQRLPGGPGVALMGGNVGIGTSGPGGKLDVQGGKVLLQSTGAAYSGAEVTTLAVGGAATYSSNIGQLRISDGSTNAKALLLGYDGTNNVGFLSTFHSGVGYTNFSLVPNGGNVGIGTASPGTKLEVNGNVSLNYGHLLMVPGSGSVVVDSNAGVYWQSNGAGVGVSDYGLYRTPGAWTANNYQQLMMKFVTGIVIDGGNAYGKSGTVLQPNGGNVGIGTATPGGKLDVVGIPDNGTAYFRSTGRPFLAIEGGVNSYKSLRFSDPISFRWDFNALPGNDSANPHGFGLWSNAGQVLAITPSGNVGIGTTNAGTYKLAVNGTIRAKEVIVDTGWADYVFDESYNLAPLSDVEAHIKAKKHLPGIPSAAEIAEHGVSMGDMQSKLLSKVEELTLHLIRMEKENAELRQRVQKLETTQP